jgi:predicted aspartyl protease
MPVFRHTLPGALALALLPLLSQAADAGSCHYVPLARLAVASSAQHMPTVSGSVNGQAVPMLVDTGAFQSMLMRPGAERLDLRMEPTGAFSYGAGGASLRYVTQVKDFAVGDTHSGQAQMWVLGALSFKPDFDAIVGADYLLQGDMELALADHYLQFFRASGCADTHLAYWDANAIEIPVVATVRNSKTPLVEVELNGVKLRAMIDSGAPLTTISRRAAEQAGVKVDAPGVRRGEPVQGVVDKTLDTWVADFTSFRIGDETVRNPQMTISENRPGALDQSDVVLGDDFLRAHRVLFATSQNRVYLSYLGGELFGAHARAPAVAAATP